MLLRYKSDEKELTNKEEQTGSRNRQTSNINKPQKEALVAGG